MKLFHSYIDGRFVPGVREFPDINTADGSLIGNVTEADSSMVDAAVFGARKALGGGWGRFGVQQRAAMLYKVADVIESRFDCFVQAEVADTGKPISLASRLDVPRA